MITVRDVQDVKERWDQNCETIRTFRDQVKNDRVLFQSIQQDPDDFQVSPRHIYDELLRDFKGIYDAHEGLYKQLIQRIDGINPSKLEDHHLANPADADGWHQRLVQFLAQPTDRREPLLDEPTREAARWLCDTRHAFHYAQNLNSEGVRDALDRFDGSYRQLHNRVDSYVRNLKDHLNAPIEGSG